MLSAAHFRSKINVIWSSVFYCIRMYLFLHSDSCFYSRKHWRVFALIDAKTLGSCFSQVNPKTCLIDPILTSLLRHFLDCLRNRFYPISDLQLLPNSAGHVLTGTRGQDHITPVLKSLHQLHVRFRVDFKVILFVFKCLNGLGPSYLSILFLLYHSMRILRYQPFNCKCLDKTQPSFSLSRLTFLVWPFTYLFYSVNLSCLWF